MIQIKHKKAKISFTFLLVLVALQSCIKRDKGDCNLSFKVDSQFQIEFSDTLNSKAESFCFSPFDPDKIWVKLNTGYQNLFEIDLTTKTYTPLDKRYAVFFYNLDTDRKKTLAHDTNDSLIWLGGEKLYSYNTRQKKLAEYNTSFIQQIFVKSGRIYFITPNALCYLEKKSGFIDKVEVVLDDRSDSHFVINDSLILLNKHFTYNFYTHELKKDDSFYKELLLKNAAPFQSESGTELYSGFDQIFIRKGNSLVALPEAFKANISTKIDKQCVWQSTGNYFFEYNTVSGEVKKYFFRYPFSLQYNSDFIIDGNYVWIKDKPFFVSLIDGKNYTYPIKDKDSFRKIMVDNCNVYLLFQNKIVVSQKESFIHAATYFDALKYDSEYKEFHLFLDSIDAYKDTTVTSAYRVFTKIKDKYGPSNHAEIQENIKQLETVCFSSVKLKFPYENIKCYKDETLPLHFREYCLNDLIKKYARQQNVEKVLLYAKEFNHVVANGDTAVPGFSQGDIENVLKHKNLLDSLKQSNLPRDSVEFLKAQSLLNLCCTSWFEAEGMYNYEVYRTALKQFLRKYPESNLTDNAEFLYLTNYYANWESEGGPSVDMAKKMVVRYKEFLKKYPDNDIKNEVDYKIFTLMFFLEEKNPEKIIESGNRYMQNYPNDKHLEDVRYRLEYLKSVH